MIKEICVQNFRSISSLNWSAKEKINVLLGKNGIGKSSFLSAVRFALTGEFDKADIADGEGFAKVSVLLDDGSSFSRTVFADSKPVKVTVNGKNATAKVLGEKLETHFGISVDDMKFISSSSIGSLRPSEFAEFIGKFLPDKIKAESVLKAASSLSSSQKEFLKEMLPNEFMLKEIGEIYNEAANCRKVKKQELAQYTGQSVYTGVVPKLTAKEIDARLGEIAFAKRKKTEIARAVANYNEAVARLRSYEAELADLKKQAEAMDTKKPSPKIEEVAMAELSACSKNIAECNGTISVLEKNTSTLTRVLENLSSDRCPLSDKVVCTTDKSAAKEEIEETIANNKKQITVLKEKITELSKKSEECKVRLNAYRTQRDEYNKKSTLLLKISTMEKNKPVVPEKPPVSAEEINAEEEASLQEAKRQLALLEQSRKAKKIAEMLSNEIKDIDVVVKELSPKGSVRKKVVYDYLSFFESEINAIAKDINSDFEFNFSVENGITPNFKAKGGACAREYEHLSKSEQIICDLILLLFCSKFSGTGMVLIDNFNDLDEENMAAVLKKLTMLGSEYPIIFIAAVKTTETTKAFASVSHTEIF